MTEHIGIYRVERPIGRGGMGEVFLAWDDRLERRVAIKRIRRDAGLSAEQRERFRREARLAARLSHSAVVQIYDLVTGDAEDAIVMEYVEGRTLAERLADGPLEMAEALRLAQEIAQGLAAAHEAGLIHRDLKAANVVVTPAGHAKILDFGLARPAHRRSDEEPLTRQGFVIGTFHAMSPEQARGEELDKRSDLFSFGALLYEMLTGQAPFRSPDAFESLRRVVQEPAPDPKTLRPEIPEEVLALLDRLLAKNRGGRPASAADVVEILERLRIGSSGSPLRSGEASVSDLPTEQVPREAFTPIASQREPLPSSLVGLVNRSGRKRWIGIAAAVALLIAGATSFAFLADQTDQINQTDQIVPADQKPAAPLRVAVAPIQVEPADDEQLALVGSGVLTAAISGLTALQGLTSIDPQEASRNGRSPGEMARATAADEVLTSTIQRKEGLAWVTLRRLGSDGRVLWTDFFPVQMNAELPDAVAIRLQQRAYPDHDLRPGIPELDVSDEDYIAFLEIQQRIDAGAPSIEPDLVRLEAIGRSSPKFLDAQLLAARLAHNLFLSRREMAVLDRALEIIRKAKELAPVDPRPLRQEIRIALSANRTDEAVAILSRIEQLLPGDPELLPLRAKLAEQQGRLEESISLLSSAVEQVPSWQNVYRLAEAEARKGRITAARPLLEAIIAQAPHNLWAKEALAYLELVYGDLERAERLYLQCSAMNPRRVLSNLGLARSLQERFQEAADAYSRALALQPNHVLTLVSLADTQMDLGRPTEARTLYRRALMLLEENVALEGPREAMLKAQCLVRLGHSHEAVEVAQTALFRNPTDSDLLYQSAVVLSLAGDRNSALNNARAALRKGVQPRWFSRPALRWMRESPELGPYLRSDTSSRDPRGNPEDRQASREAPPEDHPETRDEPTSLFSAPH